jgi:clathrin heavy chain
VRRRNPELWTEVLNESNPFKRPLIDQVSCHVRSFQRNTFSFFRILKKFIIEVLIIKLLKLAAEIVACVPYAIENGSLRV